MKRQIAMLATIIGLSTLSIHADDAATSKELFIKTVWPAFEAKCFKCHGAEKQKGEYRLDQKVSAYKGGESEKPSIVPGDTAKSQMTIRINLPEDHDDVMPPKKPLLTKEEKDAITNWVKTGAVWVEIKKSGPAKVEKVARKVAPADPATLKALQDSGALAGPLAQNTNIVSVDFMRVAKDVNDSHLVQLKKLAVQLEWLNLANTKVTDAGLANLKDLQNLTRLHLEKTGITDAGVAHLAGLKNLEYLNLYGTNVTDKSLATLAKMPNLKKVYLWQTKVTDKAADSFRKANAKIMVDNGWKAPPPPPTPVATTVNNVCPVSGKPVDAAHTFTYKDEAIGFCCPNCLGKFKAKPEDFIGKVVRVNKPAAKAKGATATAKVGATATVKATATVTATATVNVAAKTFNSKCPLSGKAVVAAHNFTYKDKNIGFCCPNCLAKFKKEPDKFFAKVKP